MQCLTEERDSIQDEVFEIRKQLGSCEFELTKERTHSECLEVCVHYYYLLCVQVMIVCVCVCLVGKTEDRV